MTCEIDAQGDLRSFLLHHCGESLATRAWCAVSPFRTFVAARRYPLSPVSELPKNDCTAAIRVGLRTLVHDVRFWPVGDGIPVPEHRSISAYVTYPRMSLQLNRLHEIDGNFEENVVNEFYGLFKRDLGDPLVVAFTENHRGFVKSLDDDLQGSVVGGTVLSLFCYLLHALQGAEDKMGEMELLLLLAARAVPIGELWDDLGVWNILTA